MEIVLDTLKNRYAKFDGRARRKEYWMFVLAYVIASIVASILDNMGTKGLAAALVMLAAIVPHIALGFRRLHDLNKSAWWMLLGLIPLINLILVFWFCQRGTVGPNQYGPDPLEGEAMAQPSPLVS